MSQQTYTVVKGVQTPAGPFGGDGVAYTYGAVSQIVEEPVPGPSTNLQFSITVDVSQVKVLLVHCTQDVTIKTNSSGSPTDTLNIVAGKPPLCWEHDSYFTIPLSADVTTIYVTNAGADALLTFLVLYDPTP